MAGPQVRYIRRLTVDLANRIILGRTRSLKIILLNCALCVEN